MKSELNVVKAVDKINVTTIISTTITFKGYGVASIQPYKLLVCMSVCVCLCFFVGAVLLGQ